MKENSNNELWVFLSHSNKDYEKVRQVRNMLEEQKFRPLMFFLCCLDDDQEIDNLIKREIDRRTRFIYCESENSKASRWVQEEVKYIRSKDRIFETINMDLPITEIKKQLDSFRKKTNIFISYQRDDTELAKAIYNRLKKYEFNVWIDFENIQTGSIFSGQITNAILNAVNNGYVITLLNSNIFNEFSWTRRELILALQKGSHLEQNVIPVVQDRSMLEKIGKDSEIGLLKNFHPIDSSVIELAKRSDFIVDAIIQRLLPPGAVLSHAKNFRDGVSRDKDKDEAEKLFRLYFKMAQEGLDKSPIANIGMSLCYEYGYGVDIDYDKALEYLNDAISEGLSGFSHIIERIKKKKEGK